MENSKPMEVPSPQKKEVPEIPNPDIPQRQPDIPQKPEVPDRDPNVVPTPDEPMMPPTPDTPEVQPM